jgi:hypothetical protein
MERRIFIRSYIRYTAERMVELADLGRLILFVIWGRQGNKGLHQRLHL